MSELRNELRMMLSAIAGLVLGRTVWLPPEDDPDLRWVSKLRVRNVPVVRELYRERLKLEADGVESVRRRAEFALTAIIAAVGLSAGAFERLWVVGDVSPWPLAVWTVGIALVVFSVLVFAGVAVSKKVIGTVEPASFAHSKKPQRVEVRAYAHAIHITSRTRRALVTVFRDGFLIALVGLALLAGAHAASWALPLDAPQDSDVEELPAPSLSGECPQNGSEPSD